MTPVGTNKGPPTLAGYDERLLSFTVGRATQLSLPVIIRVATEEKPGATIANVGIASADRYTSRL
jgi:hypothetical protein